MASSGTFAASTGTLRLEIDWRIKSQNIANNQSVVEAKVYMRTRWAIYWSANRTGNVIVDGTRRTYSHSGVTTKDNERKLMATEDFTVDHNADGTKSVPMSATFPINFEYDGTDYKDISISGTATLDAIPRASTISGASFASNLRPGVSNTLNLTTVVKYSGFDHQIEVYDGSTRVRNATQNDPSAVTFSGSQVSGVINRITESTSKSFEVRLTTKSGSTVIGTDTVTFTATVNSDYTSPTLSSISIGVRGSGYDKTINRYVQTISRADVSFNASAGQGATISSLNMTVNRGLGRTGSREGTTNKWSGYTNVFDQSGSYVITMTATNSRGESTSITRTISVLAYSVPAVTNLTLTRTTGQTVNVVRAARMSNPTGMNNEMTITVHRKLSTDSSYPSANISSIKRTTTTFSGGFNSSGNLTHRSYTFRVTVTDKFGNSNSAERTVGTASVLMSYNKDIGVGIGKIHEQGALDLQGKIFFNSQDYDFPDFHVAQLVNGYTHHAWASNRVGYYKSAGIVHIIGNIQHDNTASMGDIIFTLPEGYRPRSRLIFYAHHGTRRVDVTTLGNVIWNNGDELSGTNWRTLSQISFPADS